MITASGPPPNTGRLVHPVGPVAADVLLADGTIAVIRPLLPSDRVAFESLHDNVCDDSFFLRFLTLGRRAGHDYADHVFRADATTTAALVACVRGRVVAIATAERMTADTSEIAFVVADSERGHGVGSLLLEHLCAVGRTQGIRRFVAEVHQQNQRMLRVFADAGFSVTRTTTDGLAHVELLTAETPSASAAADERESRSESRSLAPLLRPRSVAVVGVRRDASGIGQAVLSSIVAGGFTGRLCVIHPAAATIDGVVAYPRLTDVPDEVDLVILAVPAERVPAALTDAAAAGVRGAVVISSGFSELGDHGKEIQREMVRIARDAGIRLIGPNCLGIMSNDPDIMLNATFSRRRPGDGGLAIASQSGGVGIALLDVATDLDLGVHSFVSLGNKADVSSNDLLSAWIEDPRITAAALYLESFGNAEKFARLARRFAARKPLLAVVGGRSVGGRRAGASHTAAAASPATGVDALLARAGVIACHGAQDMAEAALLLTEQPLPRSNRLAIVSNAGGMGVLAADEADEHGLLVPPLSTEVQGILAGHVSGTVGLGNPIDLGAGGSAADLEACLTTVLGSEEVDALLVVLVPTDISDPGPFLTALAAARQQNPALPVLLTVTGSSRHDLQAVPGVSTFPTYGAAIAAYAKAVRYAAWLQVPPDPEPERDLDRAARAATFARAQVDQAAAATWLTPDGVATLLGPYGLGQVGLVVRGAERAGLAAADLGFPAAVKLADPAVPHKTDRGLVRIGLRSVEEVSNAVHGFEAEMQETGVDVLVQPMVSGIELALGVVRDPAFGPLIRIAAGGIATNLWNDQAFRLPPLSRREAEQALRELKIWPLLNGFRGAESLAVGRVVDLLVELGQLAVDVADLAELDLNPLIVTPSEAVVVDAKVRLESSSRAPRGMPRQLGVPR